MARALCLLGLLLVSLTPALAVPAPMSDQELKEKSDLDAFARVLSATCTIVIPD